MRKLHLSGASALTRRSGTVVKLAVRTVAQREPVATIFHQGENMERAGATTLKGNPFTLVGPELKAGDNAPDFTAVDGGLKPVKLTDTGSKTRIFSGVPSLDTPVCDAQTKRFNEEAAKMGDVDIYTVSMDLP